MGIFTLLFAATISCALALPADYDSSRVVGGQTAQQGQFPYQVSLRQRGTQHFCGGTVINANWVLTAAHCLQGGATPAAITVVVGTNSISGAGQSYPVARLINHQGFNGRTMVNDIALIRVSRPIQFNNLVVAAQIGTQNVGPGQDVVLSGWGKTSHPGNPAQQLQFVNLKVVSNQQCQQALPQGVIGQGHICTFTRRGQGACHGDSGGPLAIGRTVVGIVSWGEPCAVGKPDVFTRVSTYASWIQQQTGGLSETTEQ